MRKQLHQSGLEMIFRCGLQFYFRYIEGRRKPPSAFLLIGSATHESVARNLGHKIETKELLPRQDAIGAAEAEFDRLKTAEPIELDEEEEGKSKEQVLGEARDKTMNLCGLHYDQVAPTIQPKHVNRKFSLNMDGFLKQRAKTLRWQITQDGATDALAQRTLEYQARMLNAAAKDGLDLAGEIDIQEEFGYMEGDSDAIVSVDDTKTASKSPNPQIANQSDQLSVYALAVKVLDGKLPDQMRLDYLVQTPAKHDLKYVPLSTTRDDDDMKVLLSRLAYAVQTIRSGMFVPTNPQNWWCSSRWCAYADQCPAFKKPKGVLVNIQEKANGISD